MGKLNVKNGTPVGNEHLCRRCTWGQVTTGYRESDVLAICTNTNPNLRLPFTVHDCTEFQDKGRPDWEQMKRLAIDIAPSRISKKTKGFLDLDVAAADRQGDDPAGDEEEEQFETVDAVASACP
jgi:hypothetical protein